MSCRFCALRHDRRTPVVPGLTQRSLKAQLPCPGGDMGVTRNTSACEITGELIPVYACVRRNGEPVPGYVTPMHEAWRVTSHLDAGRYPSAAVRHHVPTPTTPIDPLHVLTPD
jgi:hypothetical protein